MSPYSNNNNTNNYTGQTSGDNALANMLSLTQTSSNKALANILSLTQSSKSSSLSSLLNLNQADQFQGSSSLQSLVSSLSDPLKSQMLALRTVQGYTEYNLKAAFQLDKAQNTGSGHNIDPGLKQAVDVYGQNNNLLNQDYNNNWNYLSAKDTAKRISDFAMEFMPVYQADHKDQGTTSMINGFFDVAENSIAAGFKQARSVLGSLFGDKASQASDLTTRYLEDIKAEMLKMAGTANTA